MHSIRIIGPGRAGTSLAAALSERGWTYFGLVYRLVKRVSALERAESFCTCRET